MSGIEWTEKTWNPVVGCTPVSPGCLNCYAATMARRLEAMGKVEYQPRPIQISAGAYDSHMAAGGGEPEDLGYLRIAEVRGGRAVFTGEVRTLEDRLVQPLHWRKPTMIFVNSMSDLFHESVPFAFIDRVFAVMALCPQHTFQVLTKRPERMAEWLQAKNTDGFTTHSRVSSRKGKELLAVVPPHTFLCVDDYRKRGLMHLWNAKMCWPLPNVWLGTSVENQATADERIPWLLKCPAAVRFLSCEPLLEAVRFRRMTGDEQETDWLTGKTHQTCQHVAVKPTEGPGIDWVIVGGESGAGARVCDVAWIRSIVRQCREAGVPCFVKQLGAKVVCRNDRVAGWLEQAGASGLYTTSKDGSAMQGDLVRVHLGNRKGRDPAEWPEDLRVREWPRGSLKARKASVRIKK